MPDNDDPNDAGEEEVEESEEGKVALDDSLRVEAVIKANCFFV